MVYINPPKIKKFYDTWNIKGFVLLSLTQQIILILFAPFRKRTANDFVIFLIWTAYLIADWAAIFAVGLISNRQDGTPGNNQGTTEHADILAFWAPFLLLHLGGPDTISAFALEDNALWLRHFLGLFTLVFAAVIVFGQSLPDDNLWVPTVLMFVAGTIKYFERTRALYHAKLDRFRESMLKSPDPGPNYAKLMEEYASKNDVKLPTHIEMIGEPNTESKAALYKEDVVLSGDIAVVQCAYGFFQIFKGLIVDLIFSFCERHESRVFFQNISSEEALKVIAVELNFIYEVLYTKVVVVRSFFGYVGRVIYWICVVLALLIFYSRDKYHFHKIDVRITYILLFGAIALDIIALFMLVFSDWTAVSLKKSREIFCIGPIAKGFSVLLEYFLNLKKINWSKSSESTNFLEWTGQILFRRWSEYILQYNLIDYCLKECPKQSSWLDNLRRIKIWVIEFLNLKDSYDKLIYVSKKKKRISKELWGFIFTELQVKSKFAKNPETAKRICAARGDWILGDTDISTIMSSVVDVDYDQSLILWHIATELCDNMDTDAEIKTDADSRKTCDKNHSRDGSCEICSREICKILSDYMLYLLVMQPTMMSAVAGIGQIRFRDTCAEAKEFFSGKDLGPQTGEHPHLEACKRLLDIKTSVPPSVVKGPGSKSVLFDASILAKMLQKLDTENSKKKWMIMSKVWVELLSYAAGHCGANSTHAAQLSKGGELITFVWLLMDHFGIVAQFPKDEVCWSKTDCGLSELN
ncbi:hypothetical protein FCV25MIE_32431 [Fagus crenata]